METRAQRHTPVAILVILDAGSQDRWLARRRHHPNGRMTPSGNQQPGEGISHNSRLSETSIKRGSLKAILAERGTFERVRPNRRSLRPRMGVHPYGLSTAIGVLIDTIRHMRPLECGAVRAPDAHWSASRLSITYEREQLLRQEL